jgi:VanZ family protein
MLSLAVAFVCLVPLGDTHPPRIPYFDKYVHVFLFGALTFFWITGLRKQGLNHPVTISVLCCIAYGMLIEILQEVMNLGRAFEWLDIGADMVGVLLASVIAKIFVLKN